MASYLAVGLRQFEAYFLDWSFFADFAYVEFDIIFANWCVRNHSASI